MQRYENKMNLDVLLSFFLLFFMKNVYHCFIFPMAWRAADDKAGILCRYS